MVENSQNTIYGASPLQQQIQKALNNVQTPLESQLSRCANVEFVLEHSSGGGFLSLNEMNFEKPLTNNLSFVNSQYTLLTNQPSQNNAVANKQYVDIQVQNESNQRQQQDTVLQTNINEEEKQRIAEDTTLQSNINTLSSQVWKKYPLFNNKEISTYNASTIDSLINTGTAQPLNIINDTNPLTSPLNLTIQPVYVGTPLINSQPATKFYTDQLVIQEAFQRTNKDNELQQQIDDLDPLIERSLVQINNAQSSVGQILNLQGVDIRVDSDPVNLNNPISVQRLSDVLENYLPSTTKLNEIAEPDQNLSLANQRITNLAQPVDNQDVATKLYVDQQIGQQASDQIKATADPTSRRVITQASEFVAFQDVVKQTINETKMVSNIPICYSSYLPQTENFQLTTHEDLSNLQGQLNTEISDRIAGDQNLQDQVNVEKGRITDLSNNVYRKWVTGANKDTTTFNVTEVEALFENGNNYLPLNIIQRFVPLNDYFDLRIGDQPTYCQNPLEDDQIVPKIYVDNSILALRLNTASLLPNGSVGFNNQRITNMAAAQNSKDAMNLEQTQQLVTEATSFSLAEINTNYPSTGQILNLVDSDVRVSQVAVNLNNPVSLNQFNTTLMDYLPTSTKLNQISTPDANVNMANQRVVNIALPLDNQDSASKGYVDQEISSVKNPLNITNAFYPLTGNLDFLNDDFNLLVKNPTQNAHPTTRQYVDTLLDTERAARQNKDDELQAGLNNRYIKYLTGGNKENSTYNALQIDYLTTNLNVPPLNVIQSTNPLNSYLDLRISNYPTYCVQPTEDDQLANKIYVDSNISALKLNTIQSPDGSVGFNNQRITNLGNAQNDQDGMNLQQTQQLVTEATSFSLAEINTNYPSTGQSLDISSCTQLKIPQSVVANDSIQLKAGVNSSNLTISCLNNNNYTIQASDLTVSSSGYLTLNGAQRVQCTTPLLSNSLLDTGSIYQVFNKSQNDGRYYQNTTRINDILSASGNIVMNGFTLSNIRDAVDILEPTNLAQVQFLIANSGFKNKIQSQSGHAQVICENGSDNISIKANNANSNILIQASDTDYTISNTGVINTQASELNVNQNALRVVGNSSQSSILIAGELRCTAIDNNSPDQVLNRQQNDARYLSGSTSLSSIAPPDQSVSFGGQLLRNLQNPILQSDASTKSYIDGTLLNYVQIGALANYLTKPDAAVIYRTEQQVDSQISNALIPYSTSSQISSIYLTQNNASITYITPSATDQKISTALVPYITQASASSIYRPLSSPDNKIQSTDGNTQLLTNTGSSGISIRANNNQIGSIYQAIGQGNFIPLVIQATDKLQFISNEGSFSFTSGSGDTTNGIYIASNTDNTSQFCWDQVIVGSGTNRQGLVLSSGHTAQNIAYNAISSNTTSNTQSLTITPETSLIASQGGNQLLMYGNSMASSFPIQNIFNKKTGLSATQTSALANEFLTKSLADSLYSGGSGIQSLIKDSGNNNSVQCNASNPGIVLSNLQNIITSIQLGSTSTSTGVAISFQSNSGALGGIVCLPGDYYIDHSANQNGFKFKDNLNNTIAFLKTPARAISEGTKQIIFFDNVQISTSQLTADSNDLIQRGYGDTRYVFKDTPLQNLTTPSANLSLNNFLITNLASGTISSGNTSSINGGNVYDYIATLPSVITQQVYTVTVFGSSTNGFQWTAFTNTVQNNTVQIQRVKGSGAQMITSNVVSSQSQTLVGDFASLQLQVANANIRVNQVVPYTTSVFSPAGQQNIASMTFSQQAISSTATCIQLYKPQNNQGSSAFILYVYVDQF